jgi:hypothetical protein
VTSAKDSRTVVNSARERESLIVQDQSKRITAGLVAFDTPVRGILRD